MKIKALFLFLLISLGINAQVEKMLGYWDTVDDKSGDKRSKVYVFKATDGFYYGKIVNLYEKNADGSLKVLTTDPVGKEGVIGMTILKKMEVDGDRLIGKVYDPESKKTYYSKVSYNADKNTLTLRGSIDKAGLLGRSQTWLKASK